MLMVKPCRGFFGWHLALSYLRLSEAGHSCIYCHVWEAQTAAYVMTGSGAMLHRKSMADKDMIVETVRGSIAEASRLLLGSYTAGNSKPRLQYSKSDILKIQDTLSTISSTGVSALRDCAARAIKLCRDVDSLNKALQEQIRARREVLIDNQPPALDILLHHSTLKEADCYVALHTCILVANKACLFVDEERNGKEANVSLCMAV